MLAVLLIERCLADTMCMALHLRYFKLPDRHPLEEQQSHLRIRRRRKQDEPSDVLKTNPLAGVRRRTKGHG